MKTALSIFTNLTIKYTLLLNSSQSFKNDSEGSLKPNQVVF